MRIITLNSITSQNPEARMREGMREKEIERSRSEYNAIGTLSLSD